MAGGYKDLDVYVLAHALAVKVHHMTMTLPKFETYEEGSQIRRSAKSVSTNIVEGFALRKYKNEYLHYIQRAYGSSEESLEHLRILFETNSLTDKKLFDELSAEYARLNAMHFNFLRAIENSHEKPTYLREPNEEYNTDPFES